MTYLLAPPIARLALLAAMALTASAAGAQELDQSAPGLARSISFAAFSPEIGIAVRPLDNTDANIRLQQRFAEVLTRRAVRVQQMPAPVVLNFETETQQIIHHAKDEGGTVRYVLIATLDDERTGQRLWQGEARYHAHPSNEEETLDGMVPILADQLGRTVRQHSFRLE